MFFIQVVQSSSSIGEIDMEGCGRSKGCYRNPQDCRESYCDLVVTWVNTEKDVHFELSGDTEGWVALGFSKDKKMVIIRYVILGFHTSVRLEKFQF